MAIEVRRNGNLYYYKKRREGGRVVSEYVGGGILVDLEQRRAENERAKREADRERLRVERMSMAEIDNSLNQFSDVVDTLMAAELISKGFHQHKRQWRRRRNDSKKGLDSTGLYRAESGGGDNETPLEDYGPYLKRFLEIEKYLGRNEQPGVMADDFLEFEIMLTYKLLAVHSIEVGQYWPQELEVPARKEVHRELLMRWYGIRRTPEEDTEISRMGEQAISDFESGVPCEQSSASAYFKQWYEQHPRRSLF